MIEPRRIEADLAALVQGQVRFGRHDRMLYATDASIYQVEPVGVVVPRTIEDAQRVVGYCAEHGEPEQRLQKVKDFWAQKGFTLPVAMDYSDQTAAAYGVAGIPTTAVIRSDGVVYAVHGGLSGDYVESLKSEIQGAIKALEKQ